MAIENFTTYTETDPLSHLTVTSSTITGVGVTRDEDTYVYDDKEIDHFDEDFTHLIDVNVSNSVNTGVCASWALTNDIDDVVNLRLSSKSFLYLQHNGATDYLLREVVAGAYYDDLIVGLTSGQTYYLTMSRDESIGTYGTLYCYIYSDSARTTLVSTLSVLLHTKLDFRYVFGVISHDDNQASRTVDIEVSNLDLGEVVIGFPIFFQEDC